MAASTGHDPVLLVSKTRLLPITTQGNVQNSNSLTYLSLPSENMLILTVSTRYISFRTNCRFDLTGLLAAPATLFAKISFASSVFKTGFDFTSNVLTTLQGACCFPEASTKGLTQASAHLLASLKMMLA